MGDTLSDARGRPVRGRGVGEHPEAQSATPRVPRGRKPAPVTRQHYTNPLVGLAKIMARHEAALQLLEADRSWIMFMDSGDLGITQQLINTATSWKQSRAQGTCNCGRRQALMGARLMELEARMTKILTDQDAQQKLITAGLLSKDPWKWSLVKELKPLFIKEGTIHAFHAMGGLPADQKESKRGDVIQILDDILGSPLQNTDTGGPERADRIVGAIRLIGTRLRPERNHRPLPKELRELLQLLKADQ